MSNIFVVILKYIVPLEKIDEHRAKHLDFLSEYYLSGIFIASGRQASLDGGVIIAKTGNKKDLENILKQDPFAIDNLALYEIYEFIPTEFCPEFKAVIDK